MSEITDFFPLIDYCGYVTGDIILFAGDVGDLPSGFLKCDGSALLRDVYPELFRYMGVTYGFNTATDFKLPNYDGTFLRGWDHGAGIDPDASSRTQYPAGSPIGDNVGSYQNYELEKHNHIIYATKGFVGAGGVLYRSSEGQAYAYAGVVYYTGGNETRPDNVYCLAAIKY